MVMTTFQATIPLYLIQIFLYSFLGDKLNFFQLSLKLVQVDTSEKPAEGSAADGES